MSKRERLLGEYLPWVDYVAPDMVLLKDGSVFMMLGIDGLPFETSGDRIVVQRHSHLEGALRDGSQDGLIYGFLQCRGMADPALYPRGRFRTAFAEQLDRRYEEKLFGTRSMWLNQTYMTVQLSPRQLGGKWLHRVFRRHADEAPAARMDRLNSIVSILTEQLKPYRPRTLGIVRRDGVLFSEIAEATAFALTGYWRPIPMTTSGAAAIFSEPVIVSREAFEIRMPHASSWGACLNMHDYPYETGPGMFDRFLSASYRHTIYHGFRCLPAFDGTKLITRKQNRMRAAGDRALSQADALHAAADMVASNRMMMGEHAFACTVFTDNHTALPEVVRRAWGDLSTNGVKVERENLGLEAVLFSMVNGNWHLRGREAGISSRNYAAFACMHNYPGGERKGFWGDPIAMFRTSGGTPFLFHLHHAGVGNCFISGMTGFGKTTGIGFLICQAERSGTQVILWDKDRGLEGLVRALGGSYLSLTREPQLAPLKRLTDSPEDMGFLSGLIRACCATPDPYQFTPEEDRRLPIALRYVMALPPAKRSLEEVRAFLGTSRSGAGARLEKWCRGGEFGWVIDGDKDLVGLDGNVIAFDQTDILDDPIASGAVLATLFHYTGKLVDGRRLLFLLDEVWKSLEVEQFHGEIHNGLKTFRKYNSPILIATQSVRDGLDSAIGHTIREQCPTQIYYGNPSAVWDDYGPKGMHLTETEFAIVQQLPPHKFLLKQGDRSVVLHAPLEGMSEVKVISGTRKGGDALKLARERTGDASGIELVDAFHEALEELAE
jgi:type IV secretion system protein VirB4